MEELQHIEIFNDVFAHRERFVRFAFSYLQDLSAAEDLVMDSFVYYWENRQRLDCKGNVPAYILTVVKHKCLDYLQLQKIHQDVYSQLQDDARWELDMNIASLEAFEPYRVMAADIQSEVRKAYGKLPEQTRKIFEMSRVRHMSYGEIAEETQLSVKAVEYHMSKALQHLRKELKDLLPFIVLFLN